MRRSLPAALVLAAAVAGCVTPRGGRMPEFVGHPIRMEAAGGAVTTLFLHPDGTVEARFNGNTTTGQWEFGDGNLCFAWRGGAYRECWPHTAPFVPGRTETVHSDRGNVVRVTLE